MLPSLLTGPWEKSSLSTGRTLWLVAAGDSIGTSDFPCCLGTKLLTVRCALELNILKASCTVGNISFYEDLVFA